jgi:hypothetical protein
MCYLELKRNRQYRILLAEQITIRLPARPMTNGNTYEKTFELKLFGSHATRIVISIQLQIKYMTNKSAIGNIPLIDSNTHEYAMVVLSLFPCQQGRSH